MSFTLRIICAASERRMEIGMAIKIFIDQGHNPVNPNAGAEGNGYREQDITYDIGMRLASLLRADPNFDVRTSRNDPNEIIGNSNATSLARRVTEANSWGADYFISLHTNASQSGAANGSEAFIYRLGSEAQYFAEQILTGLTAETGLARRGVFARPSLYVLRRTRMPAVLLEMGFITNRGDVFVMTSRPEECAEGIYNGVIEYFGL